MKDITVYQQQSSPRFGDPPNPDAHIPGEPGSDEAAIAWLLEGEE
jgi:hypothetical protein